MTEWFGRFAKACSDGTGSPWAFGLAVVLTVVWLISGPLFGFSDTWQLVANTTTTIVTTVLVLLVQNTQNRDARAVHAKLDTIIKQLPGSNRMMGAEDLPDAELETELQHRRAEAKEEQGE